MHIRCISVMVRAKPLAARVKMKCPRCEMTSLLCLSLRRHSTISPSPISHDPTKVNGVQIAQPFWRKAGVMRRSLKTLMNLMPERLGTSLGERLTRARWGVHISGGRPIPSSLPHPFGPATPVPPDGQAEKRPSPAATAMSVEERESRSMHLVLPNA